jgi:hypothetical protein
LFIYLNLPGWPCSHSKSLLVVDGRRESDTIIAILPLLSSVLLLCVCTHCTYVDSQPSSSISRKLKKKNLKKKERRVFIYKPKQVALFFE